MQCTTHYPTREKVISRTTLRLTDAAASDLAEIWKHIAVEASEEIATRFLTCVVARFDQVLRFPMSGSPRPQLATHLRVIFHDNYAIYYLPRLNEIVIVRVLHGSRDLEAIAEEEGFAL
ncbi:type II toxin-antitoxin system RelE/ParE family toxin [Alloacidobacterium dinghuense]|uniref:Type II toxin-antitoxin system RelE/ParE family toxin n=1 Tax=Alloacidobacterium dinghuense TaxID=2763107 RepID=A0A7G8BR65_9BACT|nr:type II toxin-antitoxin system RelE/ParE family toxin [Alloacidobacterium dinghuense]